MEIQVFRNENSSQTNMPYICYILRVCFALQQKLTLRHNNHSATYIPYTINVKNRSIPGNKQRVTNKINFQSKMQQNRNMNINSVMYLILNQKNVLSISTLAGQETRELLININNSSDTSIFTKVFRRYCGH